MTRRYIDVAHESNEAARKAGLVKLTPTKAPEMRERLIRDLLKAPRYVPLSELERGGIADALIAVGWLHREDAAKWHDDQIEALRIDERINGTRDWPRSTQSYLVEIGFHKGSADAFRKRVKGE